MFANRIITFVKTIMYIRLIPRYIYYKLKLAMGRRQALLFQEDLKRQPNYNFFSLMSIKYQRNIFYLRFKPLGHIFRLIAPRDSSISATSNIDGGVLFCHPYNSFINAKCIGKNFKVYHNVTIGNNNGGLPTIGDNVSIYTNAVVVGNIKVGNNVNIGAGCVVTRDVPDNCTIIGNPAIIIKRNGAKVNERL